MDDKNSRGKAFTWMMGVLLTCMLFLEKALDLIREVLEMLG